MTAGALNPESLTRVFRDNVDTLVSSLIVGYGLRFKQDVPHLSSPLMRWLDFRYRYIDPIPRPVVWSNQFPARRAALPNDVNAALEKITAMMIAGENLNRYQGRGLTLRNDSSGDNRVTRTDLLWADWGIHHLHLSNDPLPDDQFFSRPADYLLFCLIGGNVVAIIDVLRHPDKEGFSNPELMRTVASSWPDYMKRFRLNGVLAGEARTQAELHALRSAGVLSPYVIDGAAYLPPGGGITTASTPTQLTHGYDRIQATIRALASAVADPGGSFRTRQISELRMPPDFSLAPTPRGLAVYESRTGHAFELPLARPCEKASDLGIFHDLVLPVWALEAIIDGAKRQAQSVLVS